MNETWLHYQCGTLGIFLNNQPDTLIIPNLFCYKTLHVSGIFSAHHREFSTVHSSLVNFMQVFDDRFQAESCFGHLLCPSSGDFYCTFVTGKFHAGFWWPLPSRVRMEHPNSAWKRSSKSCMKLTSAECTVENSWWWAKKMPETCRFL